VSLDERSEKEDLRRVRAVCSDCAVVRERSLRWDSASRWSSVVCAREEAEEVVVVVDVRGESHRVKEGKRRREDVPRKIVAIGPKWIRKGSFDRRRWRGPYGSIWRVVSVDGLREMQQLSIS